MDSVPWQKEMVIIPRINNREEDRIIVVGRDDDKDKSYIDDLLEDATTAELFSVLTENGRVVYTPGRERKYHQRIIKEFASAGVALKNPLAVFMGGGSSSGKGLVRDNYVIPQFLMKDPEITDFVIVDCDLIKLKLPEFNASRDIEKASKLHEESKHVARQLIECCIEHRFSFVYDSTLAAHPDEFVPLIRNLGANNYDLQVVGVVCPLDVAIQREKERCEETERQVPLRSLIYTHQRFPVTFFAIAHLFNGMYIYHNGGRYPVLIARRIGPDLEIYDQELYNEFRERGVLR